MPDNLLGIWTRGNTDYVGWLHGMALLDSTTPSGLSSSQRICRKGLLYEEILWLTQKPCSRELAG